MAERAGIVAGKAWPARRENETGKLSGKDQCALLIDEAAALRPVLGEYVTEEVLEMRPLGKRSIKQVFGHLADCDRFIFRPRLELMVQKTRLTFEPIDPRVLNDQSAWNSRQIGEVLDTLIEARRALLEVVEAMPEAAIGHVATFPSGTQRTVGEYLTYIAVHDARHLGAIAHRLHEGGMR